MTFHVTYPRVLPAQRPEGHEPAAPRHTLRFEQPVTTLVSEYLGIQADELPWDRQRACFDRIVAAFDHEDAPDAHELLRCTDETGATNAVLVAYWLDPNRHASWSRTSSFGRWFAAPDRLHEDVGYWRETMVVPYDRHETIYSEPDYRIGLGRCPGTAVVPMTDNGYFGAARDRLPISAVDPLHAATGVAAGPVDLDAYRGRRVHALVPLNLTAIRSGQYWHDAGPEQREDYEDALEPKLMEGMAHLRGHPEETTTLSLRILTNLDEDGTERRETSVNAYFASLARLEDWAASHESHLRIYRHAIAKNREYGADREVVTWHEVFVLLPSASFEYVNCHARTGLLPHGPVLEAADAGITSR
ncbi:phenylacetaldoxime dehydratase family protein [Nitriliruptoraceae bacterium ZYF776]|nr:phenylacetaldoxime dehydratase family protein [Profundirhabdus halotolerans]